MSDASEFLAALKNSKAIAVAAHIHPDGDASGSLFAAVSILNDNGFNVCGILPEPVPDSCVKYIPQDKICKEVPPDTDTLLVLDCAAPERVSASKYNFSNAKQIICIDHNAFSSDFADLMIRKPHAAATAEILFYLFKECNFKITPENATRLLLGIITDTGCFKFENTSPSVLRASAELIELGADRTGIITNVFFSKNYNMLKLECELALNCAEFYLNGKVIAALMSNKLLDQYGIPLKNTDSVIETLRQIDGPALVILAKEEPDGYKFSMRSKTDEITAGEIAKSLGGGGHKNAAGVSIHEKNYSTALSIILKAVETELKK